jgi:hypothetical protein
MIRGLSIFISDLECVARPGESNHTLSREIARTFSRILDDILNPPRQPLPTGPPQSEHLQEGDAQGHFGGSERNVNDSLEGDITGYSTTEAGIGLGGEFDVNAPLDMLQIFGGIDWGAATDQWTL